MIESLTGFGRAEVADEELRYSVEIRSVNNRFLEINTRLPRSLVPFENEIRNRVKSKIQRGKVLVHISEARDSVRNNKFGFDLETSQDLVDRLREVGAELGLHDNLGLSDLIGLADWLAPQDDDKLGERRLKLAIQGMDNALLEFQKMRQEEGENLSSDMQKRVNMISELIEKIDLKADENRNELLDRLRERIEKYIPPEAVDQGRLEQEVAHLVDKIDITEEVVRMRSHDKLFNDALKSGGAVGKRLNFLLQEMNREVNTMGSKASATEITAWVVEIKEELEKMREQVQNVA